MDDRMRDGLRRYEIASEKRQLLNDMRQHFIVHNILNLITDSDQPTNVQTDGKIIHMLDELNEQISNGVEYDERNPFKIAHDNFKQEYERLKAEELALDHALYLRDDAQDNSQTEPAPPTVPPALRTGVRCDLAPGTPGCITSGGKRKSKRKSKKSKRKSKKH